MRRNAEGAAIYSRYSTDRQDSRSCEDQARLCRALAKSRGLHVVDEYDDAATSGTHMQRSGLQKLLADAGRKRFSSVIVDDLSRLSRDLGDTWTMIFGTFASMGIVVIDVMTGMASDSPGARMTFAALGMVSDGYVQMIRRETHRGLAGRALAGFATGGKTFGFTTVLESNPPQPDHPRKVRVIAPTEAAIVVRIFEMYTAGMALKKIATALNEDGIAAPHDGGKGNKRSRGWPHTTILSMLRNEQYAGTWTWNRDQWFQIPGTARYRRIPRPPSEHIVHHAPELRIVPSPLWASVQARLGRVSRGRGAKPGVGKRHGSILSGLMRCGVCGGAFNIIGRNRKAGRLHVSLGCATSRSRGTSICANRRTIDEAKLIQHLRIELFLLKEHPESLQTFVDAYQQRTAELQKAENTTGLERELRDARRRLDRITELLIETRHSRVLQEKQTETERSVHQLEARIAETRRQVVIPHPAAIARELHDLIGLMETDVPRARETLARLMPQPFRMIPDADGYLIEGGLQLGAADEPAEPALTRSCRRNRD